MDFLLQTRTLTLTQTTTKSELCSSNRFRNYKQMNFVLTNTQINGYAHQGASGLDNKESAG